MSKPAANVAAAREWPKVRIVIYMIGINEAPKIAEILLKATKGKSTNGLHTTKQIRNACLFFQISCSYCPA